MSRDNRGKASSGLRLTGSPVQLAHRESATVGGARRSRPRSALSRRTYSPDINERNKRPFSAESKSTVHNNLKSGSQRKNINLTEYLSDAIQVCPPTTAYLEDLHALPGHSYNQTDLFSNNSDYGSEDTFISLGTKIQTKAQNNTRSKLGNKNYLKYRDMAKFSKENVITEAEKMFDFKMVLCHNSPNNFNYENEISEDEDETFEKYKDKIETKHNNTPIDVKEHDPLAGRVSFGTGAFYTEDTVNTNYFPRLSITKQQLSLVEEESTQDCESTPSQPLSSLSPPIEKLNNGVDVKKEQKKTLDQDTPKNNIDKHKDEIDSQVKISDNSYDDFTQDIEGRRNNYDNAVSSTLFSPSLYKNSTNDNTMLTPFIQLPKYTKHLIKNIDNKYVISSKGDGEQHSSLECITLENTTETRNTNFSPITVCQWNERGDGFGNDGVSQEELRSDIDNRPSTSQDKERKDESDDGYPPYLTNSLSKVYTSKVIEDYKKEIEAIDNLHELTIKDIKNDSISLSPKPTETNYYVIDTIQNNNSEDIIKQREYEYIPQTNEYKNSLHCSENTELDIENVSTQELIQNYFRVKEETFKMPNSTPAKKKNYKQHDSKSFSDPDTAKKSSESSKSSQQRKTKLVNLFSPTRKKNIFSTEISETPLSSRISCVENDKDVDSWISIAEPSVEPLPKHSATDARAESDEAKILDIGHELCNDANTNVTNEINKTTSDIESTLPKTKDLHEQSTVLDIYSMLKEIESFGERPVPTQDPEPDKKVEDEEEKLKPKDNFAEIFTFLEKVENSANDALSTLTNTTPNMAPKLENLLRLSHTELAQRHITASLQLEERSCCIALLQESLANHKEQMISKMNNMEKQANKNVSKVKQECDEAIKRHQNFIDQLIKDKKTLNQRIEQLVEERRSLEERWGKTTAALEQRHRLELRNQHDKMAAAQQVARQRWVRQKAEKIKELTVKGLEGELREMADRAAAETAQLKLAHAETLARLQTQQAAALQALRHELEARHEEALVRERHAASARMEKQIVDLEATYAEQRLRLVAELRAENERAAAELERRGREARGDIEKWRQEQEKEMERKMARMDEEIAVQREALEEQLSRRRQAGEEELAEHKKRVEADMQVELKKRIQEVSAQHKAERDRDIERAIESMEAEAQNGRKDLQEALRRNKEQYETELRELGETERATLRRYQDAQARVRQTEGKCAELESTVCQLEARNKLLTEKLSQSESAMSRVREEVSGEQAAAVEAARQELVTLRSTHDEQMQQLYAKAKVAIARKDAAIQALSRELDKANEKAASLDQRLRQQRKDFLKQK